MFQQRQNFRKDNFGSSNARVSEETFYIACKFFFYIQLKKLTDKNS